MLVVNDALKIPLEEFRFTFSRSAGPGGQNVNKVNTKATLRWAIHESPSLPPDVRDRFVARYANWITQEGEVLITSQEFRDQPQNVSRCYEKLRDLLRTVAELLAARNRRPCPA